jgi:hypothetical protein
MNFLNSLFQSKRAKLLSEGYIDHSAPECENMYHHLLKVMISMAISF